MSRLIKYINEEIELNVSNLLKKFCNPFIEELRSKNIHVFIYRGVKQDISVAKRLKSRSNRKPKNTPLHLHKIFDDLFYKKFGWKARSEGIFATSNDNTIRENYGTPYLFFPIGDYKILWSPKVDDLYIEMESDTNFMDFKEYDYLARRRFDSISSYEIRSEEDHRKKMIESAKNLVNSYKTNDLVKAIFSKNEIMFKCDQYYLVNSKYDQKLKKEILE